MKNINIKYLKGLGIGLIASVLLGSCSLDEKYYSESTPDNFFTSPDNAYAVLSRPFTHWRWYVGNDRWYLQELTTDEMVAPRRGSDWYNSGEYYRLHYHTWSAEDRFIVNTYDGTTGGISRALEAKEDLSGVNYNSIGLTDVDKDDHIQQLESIIAYFYMKGLDYFGGMPIYESTEEPLKGRSTAEETFNHIETLLTNAIPKLKQKTQLVPATTHDGYISQAAAASLLAQLYFNANAYIGRDMFSECATICQDIIDGDYGAYDLADTWWEPQGFDNGLSPEIIWAVPSEYGKLQWDWYFKYFYHYNSFKYFDSETAGYNGFILTPSRKPTGAVYTEYKLGNTYEKFHNQDVRKKPYRYFGNKSYEGMFLVGSQVNPNNPTMVCEGQKEYKGQVINLVDMVARFSEVGSKYPSVSALPSTMEDGEENSGIRLVKSPQPNMTDIHLRYNPDCPVIRLAEIYYMLAECKMRAGDKAGAATLINKVRARNFVGGSDPNPVTSANLDEYRMLDEWMVEFVGEGQARRRTDLIRWGKFVTDSWWDHTPSNDPTRNIFPIPNTAIAANGLIEQNPGY
ncbi:RagB/SusD family nutrient uptake outer membrane protein [Dysgonomonas sp. 25]|uniref:RagB/SusD family nutrient uptake outer membrane protein n=1 Tax=Dysgonomonas sp. 25 TaxID=2302933 RepID=UPI0013D1E2F8|nr:RagB/SusD family nutrient uptake outer membrane protein [Dysgonomonas sp. 25]NDV70140.1 RagB/SusD family nutrient uptake outer membrane protein [Dysgonomonas sp. 25]